MARSPEDWVYHGDVNQPSQEQPRIFVEEVAFGPTERQSVSVLRELIPPPYGGFLWGYTGGSPARAAEALLTDALALPTLDALDKTGPTMGHDTLSVRLRNDFTFDVMSQLGDEWRLRRGAVLRWVRGWYVEHDLDRPPRTVLSPPAISPMSSRCITPNGPPSPAGSPVAQGLHRGGQPLQTR